MPAKRQKAAQQSAAQAMVESKGAPSTLNAFL